MMTKKEIKAIDRATSETIKLCYALKGKGFNSLIDFWDGHKHIDIAIPEAKINIEVDGIQHNTKPSQALSDLKRTYYSFKKGYFTLRIPNSLIHSNFDECLDLITEIIKENKQN
jgi:very-short-patch-repair endonuclease